MKPSRASQVSGLRSILSNTNPFSLSILSGILLSLPFFDGRLWIFAWFGFAPLFFALRGKSKGRAFLLSYFTGVIFWAGTIYWLIHVTLLGQVLLILFLSLYFGFFGLFVFASRQAPGAIRLFFIPSLWVFLEYLRAHLFSGFGWALLGYSQYLNLPIIQIADIFGAYGVSFLIIMVNLALWELIVVLGIKYQVSGIRRNFSFLVPFFCLLFSLAYGFYKLYRTPNHEPRTALEISVIQGNIPQELKWDKGSQALILDRYAQLSQKAALEKPDLIIWPEAASPGFIGVAEDDWLSEHIFAVAKETGIPLLLGSVVRENKNYFNSALLIDRQGRIAGRYDKLHLVPFGEYVPLKELFPFLETIVPVGDFTSGDSYTLFSLSPSALPPLSGPAGACPVRNYSAIRKEKEVSDGAGVKFGVLICFEDTIPELSRNFVKKGADFLVNITNDGWFKETKAPYQHLAGSVFRAVENRVPLVRAANTGVSCFIDSRGRIKAKVAENGKDIFVSGTKTETIFLERML